MENPFFIVSKALLAIPNAAVIVSNSIIKLHYLRKLVSQNAMTLAIINQVNLSHFVE